MNLVDFLCPGLCRWRFFAGAERRSRISQVALNPRCERVRAAEHAPSGPF